MATKERMGQKARMRKKIQEAMALDRLIKCFNGDIELSSTQARVGLALINKVLPDLKSVEQSGMVDLRQWVINAAPEETAEEWARKHTSSGDHSPDRKPH